MPPRLPGSMPIARVHAFTRQRYARRAEVRNRCGRGADHCGGLGPRRPAGAGAPCASRRALSGRSPARAARHASARPPLVVHRRCVAGTAALAGRTARTAPGVAPASPLLAPEEIRSIRARYGLSQAELERMLGLGAKTVVRWEPGAGSRRSRHQAAEMRCPQCPAARPRSPPVRAVRL